MQLLTPENWQDYELIDTGDGEKLERFGLYILRRPEPQALWKKFLKEEEWAKLTHARFVQEGSHSGKWERYKEIPDQWVVKYNYKKMHIGLRLGMTSFKHVGIFPEQAANWEFIYDACSAMQKPKVLNLFAYTGGASLAARAGGAEVTHCDSIKQVVSWASANMQVSKQEGIKWLVEDAYTFVKREAKRGNLYDGIILDPPAFGHGPKGEKWKLEDNIDDLTEHIAKILQPQKGFLVFNSYSLGFSPMVLQNLVLTHFGKERHAQTQIGELYFPEKSGRSLPLGIFARFR
jgi:23S rRNA (cytosine1962-C5)-methyltransferase